MSRPNRWGVIGLGVGYQHALAIIQTKNAKLVAVCDQSRSKRDEWTSEFPTIPVYSDESSMFEEQLLDVLVVASYDQDHGATVIRALNRGMHVFAEKPLATTSEQYSEIVKILRENPRLRLTTNTLLRKSPRFILLKEMIIAGELGEIFHLEGDYLYGRIEKLLDGWRGKDPNYSVTLGGAVHIVDLLLWLTGERPNQVYAIGSSKGLRSSPLSNAPSFEGDDIRIALLEFPSGMTAKVSASFACVLPHFHRIDVFGSLGTFLHVPIASLGQGIDSSEEAWSSAAHFHSRDSMTPPKFINLPYPKVPKGVLVANFNEVISGVEQPEVSEQEALDALAVCLAIDAAIESEQPVPVEYVDIGRRRNVRIRGGLLN